MSGQTGFDSIRRSATAALFGAVFALGALGVGASGAAHAASCAPASYCAQPGACLSIRQVRQQVRQAYRIDAGSGWRIGRVRLVGHAPTATCLWYEVRLTRPDGAAEVAYWNIRGGRAR